MPSWGVEGVSAPSGVSVDDDDDKSTALRRRAAAAFSLLPGSSYVSLKAVFKMWEMLPTAASDMSKIVTASDTRRFTSYFSTFPHPSLLLKSSCAPLVFALDVENPVNTGWSIRRVKKKNPKKNACSHSLCAWCWDGVSAHCYRC